MVSSDKARAQAEASFKKAEAERDSASAWAEYQAALAAIQEKTARLRALRLAKEAADEAAGAGNGASVEALTAPQSLGHPE